MPLRPPVDVLAAAAAPLTREIFGNVPGWSQWLFYGVAGAAVGLWAWGVVRRMLLWRRGKPTGTTSLAAACGRLLRDAILQRRFRGRRFASMAHVLLFSGFAVLFLGTVLVGVEHWLADMLGREHNNPVFHKGVYFGVYEVATDSFGVAFFAGCLMFLVRRLQGGGSFARSRSDAAILVLLLGIGVTGYLVEGLRIIHAATPLPGLSPVGYLAARLFSVGGVGVDGALRGHFILWWIHALLALAFIAAMPYTRLMHALAGTVNLALREHSLGGMSPVSLEEVEETGRIGVGRLTDFSNRQLVELDACVSCGRCQDACPAFEAGKPLSPRNVVQDLAAVMKAPAAGEASPLDNQTLPGDVIGDETLWACTTCGACADVCPLGVSPLHMITDMRRYLIAEGRLRGSPAAALQKTDRAGNPWGLAAADRLAWASGLDVPLASERADFELLYWVGCAAAYDRRVQKVARSVVRLLKAAGVDFAVLGPEERCTGESARRMGDELLFQQLARQNIQTLANRRVRRIVAHCPHCVNSLRRDYPQAGGEFQVVHHSQLLAELVAQGRLRRPTSTALGVQRLAYHDPCYLARANGVTEEPRTVLAAAAGDAGLPIMELPRNRRETSCCGGGGGRMWFDDPARQRVGQSRVREIAAAGTGAVAVACPFCLIMLSDGLASEQPGTTVRDIAEVLADAVLSAEATTPAGSP